jgi:hypothetical protein
VSVIRGAPVASWIRWQPPIRQQRHGKHGECHDKWLKQHR